MLSKLTNAAGFKNAEEFWSDPSKRPPAPPQQPPPDPKLIEVQQKGQIESQKMQQDAQVEAQKMSQEAQIEQQRIALDKYKADLDAQIKVYIEQLKIGAEDRRAQPGMDAVNSERMSSETMTAATQAIMEGLQMMQASQAAQMQAMQAMVAAATAPKQVLRDQNGRVIGVAPAIGQ
jgi:hypothetical protein